MNTVTDGKHTFEVVESIPADYTIWNIGKNMVDGYLPLCQTEDGHEVKVETLKAVKVEKAQVILSAVGFGPQTIKEMETYIKRYSKSKREVTRRRVERLKAAVEVMKTLNWE